MGNLFAPKVDVPKPSASERAAGEAADRERIEATREQARKRTEQLMRLFGSRSSLGFGNKGF
jgi:hypothetical protein